MSRPAERQPRAALAFFTRIYPDHLEEAVRRSEADPPRCTALRSKVRWVAAARATQPGPCDLYIARIGGGGLIEYIAQLEEVLLDPRRGEPDTERLLGLEPEGTRERGEGLWESEGRPAQTLYRISQCRRVRTPFPLSRLIKASNGEPVSVSYGYSYAVVRPYSGESGQEA